MKVLLSIDFDGVLHPLDVVWAVNDPRLSVDELLEAGLFCHTQILEDLLARQRGDVELAIHSSWRLARSEERIRALLGPLSHRMRGVTSIQTQDREASILDALQRWEIPRERLVVLDDQAFHFRTLRKHLIECPPAVGVSAVMDVLDAALMEAAK